MELAQELGDREHEGAAVLGLVALLEYRGQHRQAEELLEQLGGQVTESAPRAWMPFHAMLSCSAFHQGKFEASVEEGQLGLSVEIVGEPDPRWALFEFVNGCREWSALALWFLGRPDSALARIHEAVRDARRPARRYALAGALVHASRIRQLRREPREAEALAREAIDIALSHGFAYHHATALVLAGWAAAGDGRVEEGLAEIERGIEAHQQTGATMDRPYFLALLAESLHQAGSMAAAQKVTDQALHEIGDNEFFYRAELLRLRALLLGDCAEADQCLNEAIAVAKSQGSRALELRCITALAKLRGGRDPQLVKSLASALASFSEGLNTPDVQEAKKLAQEMSPSQP
jgi:predicted ATPase